MHNWFISLARGTLRNTLRQNGKGRFIRRRGEHLQPRRRDLNSTVYPLARGTPLPMR
ncbi:hypothetical protein J4734_25740 [Klebsiella pneumoniae]|uniref:Uncharacterized protein n=1 Tax=Klebsiella pneumoniae TaxID=573 RepID=A0A939NSD8_KLEPN|nr:hypothetical protein [Klebsiella pneumoniae]